MYIKWLQICFQAATIARENLSPSLLPQRGRKHCRDFFWSPNDQHSRAAVSFIISCIHLVHHLEGAGEAGMNEYNLCDLTCRSCAKRGRTLAKNERARFVYILDGSPLSLHVFSLRTLGKVVCIYVHSSLAQVTIL